jgi:hypothetical protein
VKRTLVAAVAVALVAAPASGSRPGQAGPEYGTIVSGIAGALHGSARLYTCSGPDLTGAVEAIGGPDAVRDLGRTLVGHALGTKRSWPVNHRAFTYMGRRRVPDFIKARVLYVVDTATPLDVAAIHDFQAIARAHGYQLVVVTRKKARVTSALRNSLAAWSTRPSGRVRIVRCV